MRTVRLSHARAAGGLPLPDAGTIGLWLPAPEIEVAEALPEARTVVITGNRTVWDAARARGLAVARRPEDELAAAVVCLPRARAAQRAAVAEAEAAVRPGGPVILDGQKTDGVEGLLRDLAACGVVLSSPVSKAHGRTVWFAAGRGLADWRARAVRNAAGMLVLPGLFSAAGADRGSELLAAALPPRLPPRVADLGAGWGLLAAAALARDGVAELHLIEAEADALDCARANLPDPRVRFHWADATRFSPDLPFDAVVCNPPFHVGRVADPALGQAFLQAAARMLAASGTLWLVANRHLPYGRTLAALFREIDEVGGDAGYRLIRAARPQRPRP